MEGLAIKLGLHCFLDDRSNGASLQSESAYRDLCVWAAAIRRPKYPPA